LQKAEIVKKPKPGDQVMLKSGRPTMTVDSVNTSIFDDKESQESFVPGLLARSLNDVAFIQTRSYVCAEAAPLTLNRRN